MSENIALIAAAVKRLQLTSGKKSYQSDISSQSQFEHRGTYS